MLHSQKGIFAQFTFWFAYSWLAKSQFFIAFRKKKGYFFSFPLDSMTTKTGGYSRPPLSNGNLIYATNVNHICNFKNLVATFKNMKRNMLN